jgi:salicylate hydroxylase
VSGGNGIAIAGAGIAGLSAAIACRYAGFSVRIYERETRLLPIGAGIQLGPNATRILERWNLALLAHSSEPEAIELRSARTGAILNTIPLWRQARARYGAPYVTLLRADLQAALLSRAEELGIEIAFGAPLAKIERMGSKVAFLAGEQEREADALLGADGLHSAVRAALAPKIRPHLTHAVAWRAILPLGAVPAPLRNTVVNWMGPGAHLVHYPVSNGAALNGVLIIDEGYAPESETDFKAFLLRKLSGWAELPLSAIASTEAWQPWPLSTIQKFEGGQGRVQLMGDAWHAMAPFLASGSVMAMEDGAAVADCLGESNSNIEQAFRLFRERRAARVWQVRDRSALIGRLYHCPQPFDIVRDLVLKNATGEMLLSRNDWLYGRSPRADAGGSKPNLK